MDPAITSLTILFLLILFCLIRNWVVYHDFDYYLPAELFNVEWDAEKCIYYLQAKKKWHLDYRTCYWELNEQNKKEYHRVESPNANTLYESLEYKDKMVVFIFGVPVKLLKRHGKETD